MKRKLRAVDLFCGAGGTTTGAIASGAVDVVLAVNHWRVAVQSHLLNHPSTRHICAEIDMVDPREFRGLGIDLLMASPECAHHSNARAGMPVDDQRRATAWCVPRWAEVLRPKWIVVENVREFLKWGPLVEKRDAAGRVVKDKKTGRPMMVPDKARAGEIFDAWIAALRGIGYHIERKLINAADHGGATKRIRLIVVGRLGRSRAGIPWPAPTHAPAQWRTAATIIDWSIACPSIFSRRRILAENTLLRIEVGLRKYVNSPYLVKMRGTGTANSIREPSPTVTAGGKHLGLATPFLIPNFGERDGQTPRTHAIDEPLPTATGHGAGGLVAPFLLDLAHTNDEDRTSSPGEPLGTITTKHTRAVAVPFLVQYHNGHDGPERSTSVSDPLPTLDTQPRHALVQPYLIDCNHGDDARSGDRVHSIDDPLGAVTTKRAKALCLPFLTQYNGTGEAESIDQPLTTVTTRHRQGLAVAVFGKYLDGLRERYTKSPAMQKLLATMEELGVCDVGYRMLSNRELARAQGFADDYLLFGTDAEVTKQIGNSVHTAVAEAICRAIAGPRASRARKVI